VLSGTCGCKGGRGNAGLLKYISYVSSRRIRRAVLHKYRRCSKTQTRKLTCSVAPVVAKGVGVMQGC